MGWRTGVLRVTDGRRRDGCAGREAAGAEGVRDRVRGGPGPGNFAVRWRVDNSCRSFLRDILITWPGRGNREFVASVTALWGTFKAN